MHQPITLPDEIVDRFRGKVMAVVGYEVDQVKPDGSSVFITHAYNHHYVSWLLNSNKATLVKEDAGKVLDIVSLNHGGDEHWIPHVLDGVDKSSMQFPAVQFFSEGNGGEFRMSYHGYPRGYAQLIESPDVFKISPMQIDTWNRETMTDARFSPGPLPKSSQTPDDAGYSGLLECPCSDRLEKKWAMTYALNSSDACTGAVQNASECFFAATAVNQSEKFSNHAITDPSKPTGCSIEQHHDGSTDVWWNSASDFVGSTPVHAPASSVSAFSKSQVNLTVNLQPIESDGAVTITIVGPADRWFGVGFGSSSMCVHMQADQCLDGGPYTIVVSGDGLNAVTERRLDFHGPGSSVEKSVTVQSNTVTNGNRTVVLTRALKGASDFHFTFDPSVTTVPIITARGCSLEFAQHCGHSPSNLNFLKTDQMMPICRGGVEGTIGGNHFINRERCAPFPRGDLLTQNNPTCFVETYRGGLKCCRDGQSLLDKDQEIPWPDQYLEYRLKFRFYFEEYKPDVAEKSVASHQDLTRFFVATDANPGEYDITQCPKGTPPAQCIQIITARFTVRSITPSTGNPDSNSIEGIKLIYAGPHCHAPSCLSMDLYNADSGQLLCHVEPIHGGGSDHPYDEQDFISIPPCLWGNVTEGLVEPQLLPLDTTLLSIKRNNSTLPHTGEMALWQMRGLIVPTGLNLHENDKYLVGDTGVANIEQRAEPLKRRVLRHNSVV